eukprot:6172618-Pleurochrysis_carterae.AAC.1
MSADGQHESSASMQQFVPPSIAGSQLNCRAVRSSVCFPRLARLGLCASCPRDRRVTRSETQKRAENLDLEEHRVSHALLRGEIRSVAS